MPLIPRRCVCVLVHSHTLCAPMHISSLKAHVHFEGQGLNTCAPVFMLYVLMMPNVGVSGKHASPQRVPHCLCQMCHRHSDLHTCKHYPLTPASCVSIHRHTLSWRHTSSADTVPRGLLCPLLMLDLESRVHLGNADCSVASGTWCQS